MKSYKCLIAMSSLNLLAAQIVSNEVTAEIVNEDQSTYSSNVYNKVNT